MSTPTFFDQQKELVRTQEEFTTGIVHIPQNTPAQVYFVIYNDGVIHKDRKGQEHKANLYDYQTDYNNAIKALEEAGIHYYAEKKHKRTLILSHDVLNFREQQLPLFKKYPEYRSAKLLKRITKFRYVFFELDNLDSDQFNFVLSVYKQFQLPVYYHRTMRGWHFLSVKPVAEELYHQIMNMIKPLNTLCPHITLRIKPNKWVGELQTWKMSNIWMPALHSDTVRLKEWLELQAFDKLRKMYMLVHYRQNGEFGDL